jgi:hypothetical protein
LIYVSTTDLYFLINDDSASAYIGRSDATNLSTNTWYHAVCIHDGSDVVGGIDIYLNGTAVDDTNITNGTYVTMESLSVDINIGSLDNQTKFLEGQIDEVKIYSRALTSAEVTKNYKHGKGKHPN